MTLRSALIGGKQVDIMTYDDSKEALVDTSNSFVWKTDNGGTFSLTFTLNLDIRNLKYLKWWSLCRCCNGGFISNISIKPLLKSS